jgi:hypothetical protein
MTPIEANQIIQAFTEVVRNQDYVFSDVSLDAITELQKTIAGIETEPPEVVAEAIRQWYLDYEKVRNAVLLEEREIVSVPRTKTENEENTVENPLQEELEKLKEKKTRVQNSPSEDIMPTEIANLFEVIRGVYSRYGFDLKPWQVWSRLNKFYPSPEVLGDYWFLTTNETNYFEEFRSLKGSHCVLNSRNVGDAKPAFEELKTILGLELVAEYDDSNSLTYKGKAVRYWKITKQH